MTIVADLHIHTRASDGLLTATEVMEQAAQVGLTAVAITDHDTVAGIDEAKIAGATLGIDVFTGVEMSAELAGNEIHILGYCFDVTAAPFTALLRQLRDSRYQRMELMIAKLNALGYQIELSEVLKKAGSAAPSRPHVARVLVEKGYLASVVECFATLLEQGQPAYVKRYKLTPATTIAAIRDAGGMAFWAHPGLVQADGFLPLLIDAGLQGLEVYHPDHTSEQELHYGNLAAKHNLFVSGGSDFHGKEAGRMRELGARGLSVATYQRWQQACRSANTGQ
ncbi:MAG: PHP domain-containing protein [Firmicutes bacterium]|nr:PHP domain-containing protein [Bacillota bacterium]